MNLRNILEGGPPRYGPEGPPQGPGRLAPGWVARWDMPSQRWFYCTADGYNSTWERWWEPIEQLPGQDPARPILPLTAQQQAAIAAQQRQQAIAAEAAAAQQRQLEIEEQQRQLAIAEQRHQRADAELQQRRAYEEQQHQLAERYRIKMRQQEEKEQREREERQNRAEQQRAEAKKRHIKTSGPPKTKCGPCKKSGIGKDECHGGVWPDVGPPTACDRCNDLGIPYLCTDPYADYPPPGMTHPPASTRRAPGRAKCKECVKAKVAHWCTWISGQGPPCYHCRRLNLYCELADATPSGGAQPPGGPAGGQGRGSGQGPAGGQGSAGGGQGRPGGQSRGSGRNTPPNQQPRVVYRYDEGPPDAGKKPLTIKSGAVQTKAQTPGTARRDGTQSPAPTSASRKNTAAQTVRPDTPTKQFARQNTGTSTPPLRTGSPNSGQLPKQNTAPQFPAGSAAVAKQTAKVKEKSAKTDSKSTSALKDTNGRHNIQKPTQQLDSAVRKKSAGLLGSRTSAPAQRLPPQSTVGQPGPVQPNIRLKRAAQKTFTSKLPVPSQRSGTNPVQGRGKVAISTLDARRKKIPATQKTLAPKQKTLPPKQTPAPVKTPAAQKGSNKPLASKLPLPVKPAGKKKIGGMGGKKQKA